jgi:small-conductance mechanosensitive channel
MEQVKEFLNLTLLTLNDKELRVSNIIWIVVIFTIALLFRWLFLKYLRRLQRKDRLDQGKAYAIQQVTTYVIYIVAIFTSIDSLGFNITVLLASSTAVLVGLGLGLQDLFKDMVAGFIILSERTVTAGDIVEINGTIGQVEEVGIRTTTLLTRENIIIIVPNAKLTADNVINWSQNNRVTRFDVSVGVAYGSDTALVKKILLEVVKEHKDVLKKPEPMVLFKDFGNSSLDFSVYFHSHNLFRIEVTKSQLRFAIDQKFRENNITIPFPQRDVWFRNSPKQDSE